MRYTIPASLKTKLVTGEGFCGGADQSQKVRDPSILGDRVSLIL